MNKGTVAINVSKLLLIVFLPLAILLTILQSYSYNQDFYMREIRKYDITNVTTMTEEDLSRVIEKIIFYLKNDDNDLNIKAVINDEFREVFRQREKEHMVDVKNLFIKGVRLKHVSLSLTLLAIIIICLGSKSKKRDIYQALLWAGITPIFLITILYILIIIDFNKYFTYFHKIFFYNDLWLLDPQTEILIQMLPLEFFIDISIRIITCFMVISIVLAMISFLKLKRMRGGV